MATALVNPKSSEFFFFFRTFCFFGYLDHGIIAHPVALFVFLKIGFRVKKGINILKLGASEKKRCTNTVP